MNPLGIDLWNWTPAWTDEALPLLRRAADMGFTAVELPMTDPAAGTPARWRAELDRLGLQVALCGCFTAGRDISSFDPAERANARRYIEDCLRTAAAVGARVFAGPLYAGGGKRHHLPEADKRREWSLAVEGLAPLADLAAELGVTLGIEPVNRYRTSVVNTVDQALTMARDIGRPNVGLLFDTYQANIEEENVEAALERVLQEDQLVHLHACANHRGAPGSGHLPWQGIMALLARYGYGGHITMETFCPGALDAPYVPPAESPDALARRGIGWLKANAPR